MATGDNLTYVAGASGRPIPLATDQRIRPTHTPTRPKPTGLDWDAITPTCTSCGQKSGQLGDDNRCPTCRGVKPIDVTGGKKPKTHTPKGSRRTTVIAAHLPEDELLRRFTGPDDTRLGRELANLEATDPKVAASAARLDDVVERITRPDDHVRPPQDSRKAGNQGVPTTRSSAPRASPSSVPGSVPGAGSAAHREKNPAAAQEMRPAAAAGLPDNVVDLATSYTPAANLDAQIDHAAKVLRTTHGTTDPVTRLLRLNAITALEALHLHHEVHQTAAEPNPPGLGGTPRPAARTEGEAVARPVTRARRGSRLDPYRDDIIRAYQDGQSPAQIGARYQTSDVTIRNFLDRHDIPRRGRSEAQKAHRRQARPTSTPQTTGDATA